MAANGDNKICSEEGEPESAWLSDYSQVKKFLTKEEKELYIYYCMMNNSMMTFYRDVSQAKAKEGSNYSCMQKVNDDEKKLKLSKHRRIRH